MLTISVGDGKVGRYLAISGVLFVLGILIAGILFWFRGELRQRLVNREVAVMDKQIGNVVKQSEEAYLLSGELSLDDELSILSSPSLVPNYVIDGLLGLLSQDRVKGLLVFDQEGFLQESLSVQIGIEVLTEQTIENLKNGRPSGRLNGNDLELILPLVLDDGTARSYIGAVILFLDATELLDEYQVLDSQLVHLSWILILCGGGLIALVLQITFRRMEVANRLLEERGQRLATANEKLLLASKTSAVGSLTANLVHGLKNPLSSLKEFLSLLKETDGKADLEDMELAGESLRRMQDLIQDTLSVMQSSDGADSFSFQLAELKGEILRKLTPIAKKNSISLKLSEDSIDCEIDSVRGNLMVLILCNLGQNAIEATAPNREVAMTFSLIERTLICHVKDQGEGLPDRMMIDPFQSIRSQKKGGSGIGLALSQQLAQQMDAELELEKSSGEGTVFKFSLRLA